MSNINRFYTPSLPQYTSQFVEDKTPWGEMIALEDLKLQRTDKAMETEAQADAMISSLTPGLRTQEIAPKIAEQYKGRLNEWMKNYGSQAYSVPALRELTKIRSQWMNDPDVQLVLQDREASKEYDLYRRDPMYPMMLDPNLASGEDGTKSLRQFKSGDQFSPYERPFDINTFIDKYYGDLKPRVVSGHGIKRVKDDVTGMEIPLIQTTTSRVLDDSDFSKVRPDLMNALRTSFGHILSEEEMGSYVSNYERKHAQNEVLSSVSQISGLGSGKDKEGDNTFAWPGAGVTLPVRNEEVKPGGESPGFAKRAGLWIDEKIEKVNPGYYDAWRDNPDKLINLNKDPNAGQVFVGAGLVGERSSKAMIERRFLEDPAGTVKMFNEYFDKQIAEAKNYMFKNKAQADKNRFEGIIKNAMKDYKIDDQPYHNDVDLNNALNYIYESWDAATPEARNVFQKFAKGDTNITAYDWLTLKASGTKARAEATGKTFIPEIQTLPPKMQEDIRGALTGFVNDSNMIIKANNGEISGVFAGARMFDPEKPGKEMDMDDRKDLLKQGTSFILDGYLPAGTHPYKTFVLTANIGGKRVFIEGPKKMTTSKGQVIDLIEPTRFTNNAFSFELPDSGGTGDLFSVNKVNVDNLYDMKVIDSDNESKDKSFSHGIPMRVQRVHVGSDPDDLSESQASPYGNLRMIAYQGDVRKDPKSKINQPYSDSNPEGYISFHVPTDAAGRPDDASLRIIASEAYIRMMMLKGAFTPQQASILIAKLRMNYGNIEE